MWKTHAGHSGEDLQWRRTHTCQEVVSGSFSYATTHRWRRWRSSAAQKEGWGLASALVPFLPPQKPSRHHPIAYTDRGLRPGVLRGAGVLTLEGTECHCCFSLRLPHQRAGEMEAVCRRPVKNSTDTRGWSVSKDGLCTQRHTTCLPITCSCGCFQPDLNYCLENHLPPPLLLELRQTQTDGRPLKANIQQACAGVPVPFIKTREILF